MHARQLFDIKTYKNESMIGIQFYTVERTSLRGEDQSMQNTGDPLVEQGRRGTATVSSHLQPSQQLTPGKVPPLPVYPKGT